MKPRLQIVLPLTLALSAHALSWAFTAYFLHDLRNVAMDTQNEIGELFIKAPVVLTAIAAICVPFRNRDIITLIAAALLIVSLLGAMTIGLFLLPVALLVVGAAWTMRLWSK